MATGELAAALADYASSEGGSEETTDFETVREDLLLEPALRYPRSASGEDLFAESVAGVESGGSDEGANCSEPRGAAGREGALAETKHRRKRPVPEPAADFQAWKRYAGVRPPTMRLPWELPGMVGMALGFGRAETNWYDVPEAMEVPLPEHWEESESGSAPPTPKGGPRSGGTDEGKLPWQTAARSGLRLTLRDTEAGRLDAAHLSWRRLVESMGRSCQLFRVIQDATSEVEASESFEAAFFGKPSSTLAKRAGSLHLYLAWAQARGETPWPVTEERAFKYLLSLSQDRAPPSRATSWKEALGFAKGFCGLDLVEAALGSSRVKGIALKSFSPKEMQVKRDPLTLEQVRLLEMHVCDPAAEAQDKIFGGFLLYCVGARLRVGDAAKISQEPKLEQGQATAAEEGCLPYGFIEGGMVDHKRASKVRRKKVLPVVSLSSLTTSLPWAKTWLELREVTGLKASPNSPLMPAVGLDGGWLGVPIRTCDASTWIAALLNRLGGSSKGVGNVGSHSLKATLLSWAAKAGMDAKHRRLLGYHTKPKDRSMIEYSRDELAHPLLKLHEVLVAIFEGRFQPDSLRSGRWQTPGGPAEGASEAAKGEDVDVVSSLSPLMSGMISVDGQDQDASLSVASREGDGEEKKITGTLTVEGSTEAFVGLEEEGFASLRTPSWSLEGVTEAGKGKALSWKGAALSLREEDSKNPRLFEFVEMTPPLEAGDAETEANTSEEGSGDTETEVNDLSSIEEAMIAASNTNALVEGDLVPEFPEGGLVRAPSRPYTLHAVLGERLPLMGTKAARTACGREVSMNHRWLLQWPRLPRPLCGTCFKQLAARGATEPSEESSEEEGAGEAA